ncbi:MAG: isoamylase early set domain-containing protein [Niabella sp.]
MKKVKFSLPAEAIGNATKVVLLGDFNNWDIEEAAELAAQKDGSFAVELSLAAGTYEYKFYLDNGTWENDWAAESYVFNPATGVDNSVITIIAEKVKAPAKKAAAPKKAAAKKAPVKKVATAPAPEVKAAPAKKTAAKKAAKK